MGNENPQERNASLQPEETKSCNYSYEIAVKENVQASDLSMVQVRKVASAIGKHQPPLG